MALAGWALLRTKASTPPPASDQQIADARAQACDASTTVSTAVGLQTHGNLGEDPVAMQAVAANARLSMTAGSAYLLARLDPATPEPLASAVTSLANGLQDVAIHTMAGVSNEDPAQATRLSDAERTSTQIADLCR